jgi:hypothetical protein
MTGAVSLITKEGSLMIYEMRVYTLQPGKVPEFQALVEKEALPIINKQQRQN